MNSVPERPVPCPLLRTLRLAALDAVLSRKTKRREMSICVSLPVPVIGLIITSPVPALGNYNSMSNFIQVFCFLLFLGLGLGLGLGFKVRVRGLGSGSITEKNISKYLIGGAAGTVDIPVR